MDRQLPHKHALLPTLRRVVIKVGSSIISTASGIDHTRLSRLVDEIQALRDHYEVVVVSSGAIVAGTARLGRTERPETVPQKQAAAAVGQIRLMALYDQYFGRHGQPVAQLLMTHDDLANRRRYINARHTFEELLRAQVVPVVNENDTVAVEEVVRNFGDNDNLSALVATLVSADLLVILSDVDGLHTADPRAYPDAKLIAVVETISDQVRECAGDAPGPHGTGGMASKLRAAYKATEAGIPCWVGDGLHDGVLRAVFDRDRSVGTLFLPKGDRLRRRKHWIAHTLEPVGAISLDAGAHAAVTGQGRSLLPKGVVAIKGDFGAGDCVSCLSPAGDEFARGLVNYSSGDLARIKGLHSNEIHTVLGYKISDEVIHRDDLVLI